MSDSTLERESQDKSGEFLRGWLARLAVGGQIALGSGGFGILLKAVEAKPFTGTETEAVGWGISAGLAVVGTALSIKLTSDMTK